ncbi:hypothetical protein ILYODFUR_033888 [Ilyodon furcidens]|uniref:Secreted protein n=1 Tax=Ilyodon furcidens TaxID=33524 RepID=A0ABV0VJB3_9TELE
MKFTTTLSCLAFCLAGKIQELDTEAATASGQTSFLRKHFIEPHSLGHVDEAAGPQSITPNVGLPWITEQGHLPMLLSEKKTFCRSKV